MSTYVDGFVIPIPKNKVAAYKKMAKLGCKTWMKHGALAYYECIADDVKAPYSLNFPTMCKTKKNETVIFAFIVFKSKAHRNQVNKKVHKEFGEMPGAENFAMPFDVSKMAYGGFKTLIQG
ncbi:DUF1428 domain-containing protein [Pseudobdellovibrio sp. HCB154]|uniref:DUF1428 domain-containing protein n=1 Tax=Pseudobdellovibrio sp. HCB154 TaxID=3386277 RepID=UPI0039170039